MTTILITGAAGYIGSHVLHVLQKENKYKILALDNLRNGNRDFVSKEIPFFQVDTSDSESLDGIFKKFKIDAVMHFAAFIEAGESVNKPAKYFQNNFSSTLNLLEVMFRNECKKIIFSSTAAVYGEPQYTPIDEQHPLQAINPYGKSKSMVEDALHYLEKSDDLRFISFRYFNAGGNLESGAIGEAHDPETHLIPILLKTALGEQEVFKLFGRDYPTSDGTCIRDYIHVLDLAKAHVLGLESLLSQGKSDIFNLGSENGFSNLEIYKKACQVTGVEIPLQFAERRKGDPSVLLASSKKAKEKLGWRSQFSDLGIIIETAWKWHLYRKNQLQKV